MAKVDASNIGRAPTIGEVAARSGAAVSTLHFYEAKGLISSSRNTGNQRRHARGAEARGGHQGRTANRDSDRVHLGRALYAA